MNFSLFSDNVHNSGVHVPVLSKCNINQYVNMISGIFMLQIILCCKPVMYNVLVLISLCVLDK